MSDQSADEGESQQPKRLEQYQSPDLSQRRGLIIDLLSQYLAYYNQDSNEARIRELLFSKADIFDIPYQRAVEILGDTGLKGTWDAVNILSFYWNNDVILPKKVIFGRLPSRFAFKELHQKVLLIDNFYSHLKLRRFKTSPDVYTRGQLSIPGHESKYDFFTIADADNVIIGGEIGQGVSRHGYKGPYINAKIEGKGICYITPGAQLGLVGGDDVHINMKGDVIQLGGENHAISVSCANYRYIGGDISTLNRPRYKVTIKCAGEFLNSSGKQINLVDVDIQSATYPHRELAGIQNTLANELGISGWEATDVEEDRFGKKYREYMYAARRSEDGTLYRAYRFDQDQTVIDNFVFDLASEEEGEIVSEHAIKRRSGSGIQSRVDYFLIIVVRKKKE